MLRKTMLALAFLALLGLAAAQITITPTLSSNEDAIAKGVEEASVGQTVVLELPEATALHLAASTITFDLAYLDGNDWEARARGTLTGFSPDYACVYVSGADVPYGGGDDLWGQGQTVPGGIGYDPVTWNEIKLVYFGNDKVFRSEVPDTELVVTYPPIRLVDGALDPGSKDYFVCYQTFVIQLFSNFENFSLQVSRADADAEGTESIQHLYVQGNTCAEFGDGTGLYALPNTPTPTVLNLLPKSLTEGPTGSRNSADCNPNSSWMDVLGVLAVKVNADLHGTNTANLTYTLLSSDTGF